MSIARAGGARNTADTVCSTELAKSKPIIGFLRPDYCAHRAQLAENDRFPALIATWRSGTRKCGTAEVAGLRAVISRRYAAWEASVAERAGRYLVLI